MEQLELEPGDLVDFWRKPATKDESGWRGPARVVEPGDRGSEDSSSTIVQWQGRAFKSELNIFEEHWSVALSWLSRPPSFKILVIS